MSGGAGDHGNGFRSTPSGNTGEGGAAAFPSIPSAPRSYALSGKIMLSAIVVLFTVVLLILCLHVYARWYLLRRARLRRRSRRRLVFAAEHQAAAAAAATRGLDPEVIMSLPVFTYSAAAGSNESVECAVCLSEFQENEKVRQLPRCKHSFHIECIDMWFYSHATCPLCRSTVELESTLLPVSESVQIRIEAPAPPEQYSCDSCRRVDEGAAAAAASSSSSSSQTSGFSSSSSSLSSCSRSNSSVRDALSRIEVPPRRGTDGFMRSAQEEVGSPGVAQGLKSPISRMASLKRILSFDLRFYRGGGSSIEPDVERGGAADAAEQQQQQQQTAPQHQQQQR